MQVPWSCENLKFWHIPDNFQQFYVRQISGFCQKVTLYFGILPKSDVRFRGFAEITRIECSTKNNFGFLSKLLPIFRENADKIFILPHATICS